MARKEKFCVDDYWFFFFFKDLQTLEESDIKSGENPGKW